MSIETYPTPPDLPNASAQHQQKLTQTARSGGFGTAGAATVELANRLFDAPERWGWEYVEPRPPAEYPHLGDYPAWVEPLAPDLNQHERALALARAQLRKRLMIAGGLVFLALLFAGLSGGFATICFLAGLGVAGFAAYQIHAPQEAIRAAKQEAANRRASVHNNFLDVKAKWDDRIREWDANERKRFETDALLFPLAPGATASRVDVVGGTPSGWAAMITTMGSSVLASGGTLLVLDLSRHDAAAPLASLVDDVRGPRQEASVPAALEAPWLLGDLEPRQLAQVLAGAIDSMHNEHDSVDLGAMDAEIIRTVASRIEHPYTFARLAAGVRVLRQAHDVEEDSTLSATEVGRLTEKIDVIARGERMRDELAFVGTQLEALAEVEDRAAGSGGNAAALWPIRGLSVIRSDVRARGRNSLRSVVDRVAFGAVAHQLATDRNSAPNPTLVVVGADDLGRAVLEEMAQNAYRAGVRLVYFFEHLKRDAEEVIGGGGSVSVLMRMGNGREAQTAAEFVGHGFSFQVSQLSRQVGESENHGGSRSVTETEGRQFTEGVNGSRSFGHGGGSSEGWSRSTTESWSTAVQHGTNWSTGTSETNGVTMQRSREFTVEPTQIQTLEETAFMLVDSGPQGRRVRVADCYPGSVFVDRRSITPR